jgi:molybdenum cofactor biosynthesis protein B
MAVHEHKDNAPRTLGLFVITISDSRTESTDHSGQLIKQHLRSLQHRVVDYRIVRDEPEEIESLIRGALVRSDLEVILLNGGTGISPRDGTYEVVNRILEKRLEGFGEIFRYLSFQEIGSAAIMSRAVAGVAQGKVIISLPGSTGAVDLAMRQLVLPELGHLVSQVKGQ